MLTSQEWQTAVMEIVQSVLSEAELSSPPVDALALAKSLAVSVSLSAGQPHRGRTKRIAGRTAMFLRPEARPERLQWAAAHELGESLAWKVCRALGLEGHDLSPRQREELANQLAKEFLLPRDWFRRDCAALHFDLPRLKARYRTASHELIAWRWLDLDQPGIVTIFDHGVLTRRQSNGPASAPALTDAERCCWTNLCRTRQPASAADPRLTVRGWCVDSPGWEREILYATWDLAEE